MLGVRGSSRAIALSAGALAAVVTVALLVLVLVNGPGLNPFNAVILVSGALASALTVVRPDRPAALVASAVLLTLASALAAASVGWLYVPSLVLLLISLGLSRRRSRS